MKILSLLLFFIALGVLVTIHEFGHFLTAKTFNVYCSDFSIGFGYKILKIGRADQNNRKSALFFINRKNPKAETTFSVGIIPLGGYVGMLGDDNGEVVADRPDLRGRSIEDLSLWKKIIVFCAGIVMNFVLAWLIFFISASCFEQKSINYIDQIGVHNKTLISQTITRDIEGKEPLKLEDPSTKEGKTGEFTVLSTNFKYKDKTNSYTLNDPFYPVKIEGNSYNYALVFETSNYGLNDLDYANAFKLAVAEKSENGYFPEIENKTFEYFNFETGKEYKIEPIKMSFQKVSTKVTEDNKTESNVLETIDGYLHLSVSKETGKFNKVGFGTYVYSYWNGWKSFEVANKQFARSTSLISETIAKLFYNKETWGQVGGPVAIFTQTTSILTNYPFYYYLNSWGIISVNLALFNLIPFPGLDGWAILVALIEGIVNLFKSSKVKKEQKKKLEEFERQRKLNELEGKKEVNIGEKAEEEKAKPWKFPPKIKTIVSYVGLGLLFLLAILIFIRDIYRLF